MSVDILVVETGEQESNEILSHRAWEITVPAFSLDKKLDGLKKFCIRITLTGKKGNRALITIEQGLIFNFNLI